MHLIEALIEAATGNNWHNCSWNGRTGRFCQENGPSTCATYSGDRTSEVYFAGNILRISTCMESRFAVESFFISAVGAGLQLSYGRSQFCGEAAANFVVNWNLLLRGPQTSMVHS